MGIKYRLNNILGIAGFVGKEQLAELIAGVDNLAASSKNIMIAPLPTGYNWLGVYNGGKSLMPQSVLDLPQYYSNPSLSKNQITLLAKHIAAKSFENVIFNGFPLYFGSMASQIRQHTKVSKLSVFYHGFPAELTEGSRIKEGFKELISLSGNGVFNKLAFAKKGLALTFEKLFNIKCFELIYENPGPRSAATGGFKDGKWHIGVLVNHSFRKNFHTQVLAALMVDNSIIHVPDDDSLYYLNEEQRKRIVAHGLLPHDRFIELLGTMSFNIHATFSEASGGQVCSESISQGVPCISANTSSFFEYDDYLNKRLVVNGHDDSYNIFLKIKEILPDLKQLSEKCLVYSEYMNKLAHQRMSEFINF